MTRTSSVQERQLWIVCVLLLLIAVLGPPIGQPAHYHHFADQAIWGGIPHAMDVLSNLPFALWGLVGLWALWCAPRRLLVNGQGHLSALFFSGLLLTAAGSSWYHWQPDDAGLLWDRLGMAVAFAGLLGLVAAGQVSQRAGYAMALGVLLCGSLSVALWMSTGNVLPWAVLQFGGMVLIVGLAMARPNAGALPIRWAWVILFYAAAKVLEHADHQVFALLGNAVSGHSLKHIVASFAAWPVFGALRSAHNSVQNVPSVKNIATFGRQHVR